jgi:uncharacterized protein (TIGR02996 family)
MERESLIEAIRSRPDEDTPRLMYADWLEEYGQGDVDKATIEFIRVSCSMKLGGSKRMPKAAYQWIRENWKRLVPETLKMHTPWNPNGSLDIQPVFPLSYIKGRIVFIDIGLHSSVSRRTYRCHMGLEFWKGFVQDFLVCSNYTRTKLKDVLKKEQPLVWLKQHIQKQQLPPILIQILGDSDE